MLNFIVTNHWWQKYQNHEKNHEYRRAYTADHEMPEIYSICIKNGLDTDLKIDDWVYDFEIKEATGLPF